MFLLCTRFTCWSWACIVDNIPIVNGALVVVLLGVKAFCFVCSVLLDLPFILERRLPKRFCSGGFSTCFALEVSLFRGAERFKKEFKRLNMPNLSIKSPQKTRKFTLKSKKIIAINLLLIYNICYIILLTIIFGDYLNVSDTIRSFL